MYNFYEIAPFRYIVVVGFLIVSGNITKCATMNLPLLFHFFFGTEAKYLLQFEC